MSSIIDKSIINRAMLSPLCEQSIRQQLVSLGIDNIGKVLVFSSVTSTNDCLLENELDNKNIAVCIAEKQTQGRGRYGHHWVSPSSVNLYLSISYPLQVWSEKFETLSLWLLLAIAEVLEKNGCADIQLKWPNDICVGDKKLAGILIERKAGRARNNLIIGVGMNVAMSLNENIEVKTPWTDLISINPNWNLSRNELAANLISIFCKTVLKLENNQLNDLNSKWACYDMLRNKKVELLYQEQKTTAYAMGLDELGQIILDIDGKIKHLHSAYIREIRIIGN